jgi:lysozyme
MSKCIDISHWQGSPDFERVKAAGVLAVIHKATEGVKYVDPDRAPNCSRALRAGLKICTYHWLKPGPDPVEQMAFYLKTVNPVAGERVVIDYEEDGCNLTQLKIAVQALLADPRGLQITIYSGHLLKQQLGDRRDEFLARHTSLWLAQYTTDFKSISWPRGTWPRWTLHQYTDKGAVDGIDGNVDLNRFNGGDNNLLRWIGPPPSSPGCQL